MSEITENRLAEHRGMFDLCLEIDLAIQLRDLKTCGDVLRFVRARMQAVEGEAALYGQAVADAATDPGWDFRAEARAPQH